MPSGVQDPPRRDDPDAGHAQQGVVIRPVDLHGEEVEVTLYHNGYAIVDVDGRFLFDGSLTSGASDCAHLSYYHADSGEKITLN